MSERRALLVMAKAPMPGDVKTRLIPNLSADEAAGLYRCFMIDILSSFNRMTSGARVTVAYQPHSKAPDLTWTGAKPAPDFFKQEGSSLGEKIIHAFGVAFGRGHRQVVVIGSDSPTLPPAYLDQAFQALEDADVVLGPTTDGGYYLIGLSRPCMKLFENIAWSTDQVYERTAANAQAQGYRLKALPMHYDIDTIDDVATLVDELHRQPELCPQTRRFLHALSRGGSLPPAIAAAL